MITWVEIDKRLKEWVTKERHPIQWLKDEIAKDQHPVLNPEPIKGEPYWVTKVHEQQKFDFRTGKRNDGSD